MGLFGRFKRTSSTSQEANPVERRRQSTDQEQEEPHIMASEPDSVYNQRKGNSSLLNSTGSMYRNGVMATPRSEGTPYDVAYGHTRVFVGADHAAVLDRMQTALLKQGFRILSSIDLQHSLKSAKVSCGDFRQYTILTACHPKLFYKGVFEEPSLGLLPPSNIVIMEGDFNKSDIVVQITKPSTIYRAIHNQSPKLRGILSETDARLKIAMDSAASSKEE